ncbi:L-threonylcarbamoyladenylate synthase [Novosphingobium sp. JCM 18896]|uniref:L-threonylcarbamoyladenylate synthase n=1 Tax=Novosphingobium sp. JCM 18896 TaxID=2989731 RepID=UPI002221D1DB|nr:L-threonylcarbamoyladenylate synthase [Novosphingobium sp. JCM 18896]MCW1429285.1 L-threonylcarbamoyladenylate synthase [Novosphingobium sp. JCM 18896]
MTGNSQASIHPADAAGIASAAAALRAGGLVALPTETVYGLAARADSDDAVAAIYRAKGRPDFNPLIVHVEDLEQAGRLAVLDVRAEALAEAFWPGPLTLVLPRRAEAPLAAAVTAGLPTVALRCPAHPVMRAVLAAAGLPLAAPSANRSGAVSPTLAAHVAASLAGKLDLVLDGGACEAGIESTIVALRADGGWQVLRPGPITAAQIAVLLGGQSDVTMSAAGIEAPGQLASHYAPGKPVRLGAEAAQADEFHIGFGAVAGDVTLSASGDLAEAAARLYVVLHEAAAAAAPRIAVAPIPEDGIGLAINDRLRRAAA